MSGHPHVAEPDRPRKTARLVVVALVAVLLAAGIVAVLPPTFWPTAIVVSRLESLGASPGSCEEIVSLGEILTHRTLDDTDKAEELFESVMGCHDELGHPQDSIRVLEHLAESLPGGSESWSRANLRLLAVACRAGELETVVGVATRISAQTGDMAVDEQSVGEALDQCLQQGFWSESTDLHNFLDLSTPQLDIRVQLPWILLAAAAAAEQSTELSEACMGTVGRLSAFEGDQWMPLAEWCSAELAYRAQFEDALTVARTALGSPLDRGRESRFKLHVSVIVCLSALERPDEIDAERDRIASETSACRAETAIIVASGISGSTSVGTSLTTVADACSRDDASDMDRLDAVDLLFDGGAYGGAAQVIGAMGSRSLSNEDRLRREVLEAKLDIIVGDRGRGSRVLTALAEKLRDPGELDLVVRNHIHVLAVIGDVEGIAGLYSSLAETRPEDIAPDLWMMAAQSLADAGRCDLVERLGVDPANDPDSTGLCAPAGIRSLIDSQSYALAWSGLEEWARTLNRDHNSGSLSFYSDSMINHILAIAQDLQDRAPDAIRMLGVLELLEQYTLHGSAPWQLVASSLALCHAELGQVDEARTLLHELSDTRFQLPGQLAAASRIGPTMALSFTPLELSGELQRWKASGHGPGMLAVLRLGAADTWMQEGAFSDARSIIEPLAGTPLSEDCVQRYYPVVVQAVINTESAADALDVPRRFPAVDRVQPCRLDLVVASCVPQSAVAESFVALERALAACNPSELDISDVDFLVEGLCSLGRFDDAEELTERFKASEGLSARDQLAIELTRARILTRQERFEDAGSALLPLTKRTDHQDIAAQAMLVMLAEVYPQTGTPASTVYSNAEATASRFGCTPSTS